MKYIKKFSTHAEYEAAESSLILPNVSFCVDTPNEVHYNPYVAPDPYNGHDYVDLGLPSGTKWATINVGATSETDYGNYYQYGKGADDYSVTSGQSNYSGTENPLAASADTATQVWGGSWHIPTYTQLNELNNNTTYEWVTNFNGSGVNGGKFTATDGSGNYIFIPAAGNYSYGQLNGLGTGGGVWSSTPDEYTSARCFYIKSKNIGISSRLSGYSVRGVVG